MDHGPGRPSTDGGGRATTEDGTFGGGLSRLLLAVATGLALVAALPVSAAVAGSSKPSNTSRPTVSGVPRVGQTLTAAPGTWSGAQPITYRYQWRRCSSGGGSCADISGARSQTYELTAADIGSTIRIRVRATNTAGSTSADSAPTALVESPPLNTSPPTVTGTPVDGAVLTATAGIWSGTQPLAYAHQWQRCDSLAGCHDVIGATGTTYALRAADVGFAIRVVVTASNAVGSSSAASAPTAVVTATEEPPVNTAPPAITGTAVPGTTLTADPGLWSGTEPIAYAYQWQRCDSAGAGCLDIAGASAKTYTVATADAGSSLRVVVSASNAAGSGSATSATTGVEQGAAPHNASAPTISGTAQQSLLLTAGPGSWTGTAPIAFAYRWRRCDDGGMACGDIAGATSQGYTPVAGDVGSSLRVAVTATNAAGSATAESAPTSTVTVAGSVGYRGPSFSGAGTAPTGSKPESKLWFNDGAWWAAMWAGSGKGFRVFRLDPATQRWSDTGVALDDRSGTRADVLWDGGHLYVASHVFASCGCSTTSAGFPSRLYRYSYDAAVDTYILDPGFPVQINNTKTETLVIDRDSTGTVWATWVQDRRVMVTHTQGGDDRSWVAPYLLPVAGAANPSTDDISSIVAYGGNAIGVMWSNQTDSAFYFASHADGAADSTWSVAPALQSPLIADDHVNLKSLHSDGSGRVFAIAKTSLNDLASPDSSAPGVVLMARVSDGRWSHVPVWRVGDGVTRPMLLIDEANHVLHALATSSESGGTIRLKSSPISSIAFPTGLGTVFLRDASGTNLLNNATSTKQNLTRVSGMVVLASNDSNGYYWHNAQPVP
jgi:hypothetical protein